MTAARGNRHGSGLSVEEREQRRRDDHPAWVAYSRWIQRLAPLIVVLWIGGAVASLVLLPRLTTSGSRAGFSGAVSSSAPPIATQVSAIKRFGYPLIAQNVVVQYRPGGLSPAAQAKTVATAVKLDMNSLHDGKVTGSTFAVPVTSDLDLFPSAHEANTTALTYLFYRPSVGLGNTYKLSKQYASRLSGPGESVVGVTGAYQAEVQQGKEISGALDMVEYASIGILLAVVGFTFRSVVAPALTLFTAVMTYELSERLLSWATIHLGIQVPNELDPIIVVLLLGIVTDYSVFYLSAVRRQMKGTDDTKLAVRRSIVEVTPLVMAASVTVAAGVTLITAARLPLFSELGPGLAISVGVAVLAVTTFTPAALCLLRSVALWPAAERAESDPRRRRRVQQMVAGRKTAAVLSIVGVGVLVYLATFVGGTRLGINLVQDLPASSGVVKASNAASRGFAPGIVEPTEVVVTSAHRTADQASFSALQARMARFPGVDGVIGPGDIPPGIPVRNVFISGDHRAARYLVILADPPLQSAGINDLNHLRAAMPTLTAAAGLQSFNASFAGDTAVSHNITAPAGKDLLWVGLFVAGADLIMTIVLLRSVLGPVILTLASMLVVASAVGITTLVFPGTRGTLGFTFYVPFACEVLLLSFGADYNLFVSGEIWETSRWRRFRRAVPEGSTSAAQAINTAGITLALSFSALALVPLHSFRQIAFCMAVGLLIDTFVVRFLIVPALFSLFGPVVQWPTLRGAELGRHKEDSQAA